MRINLPEYSFTLEKKDCPLSLASAEPCTSAGVKEPHRLSGKACEKENLDQAVCLTWIIPLEVDLMKVWVIREEEEGKAEKEGRSTDQYFKHNPLTRAWGWRGARRLV